MSAPTLAIAAAHGLSLALYEGGRVLRRLDRPMLRGQAEAIVPAIREMLGADGAGCCARIVVETGPGSFTGLRIGLAAASALGLAWRVPVVGVRSTQLVAASARAQGEDRELLVLLAAPRGQIWIERFASGGLQSLGAPAALMPDAAKALAGEGIALAGSGVAPLGLEGLTIAPAAAAAALVPDSELGAARPLYVRIGDQSAPR